MSELFDAPVTPPLRSVLHEIETGKLLIPKFQRPFVWNDEQRLNLLDSIARGIPIGALLVWRTSGESGGEQLETYEAVGPWPVGRPPAVPPWTYVIDGHQRLTTLYAALTTPLADRTTNWQGEDEHAWPVFIDLELDPESRIFVLPSRRHKERPTLIPTNVLLSNRMVYKHQQALWKRGLNDAADRLEALANIFKDYPIPIVPMVSDDLNVVTQAFARINTSGTTMSEANLASAIAYGRVDLRGRLQQASEVFAEQGWSVVDEAALLDLHKLRFDMDVYKTRIEGLLQAMGADRGDATTLDGYIQEATGSLQLAIHYLSKLGVLGSNALPYRYQLLVLAEALRRTEELEPRSHFHEQWLEARIRTWFWQTTFTEHFRGATGSTVRSALYSLTGWLTERLAAAPLSGEPVRFQSRRQNWGAVTSLSRLLVCLEMVESRNAEAAQKARSQLAQLGGGAVHKVLPRLDTARPGAWVVADPEELREFRGWLLGRGRPTPPLCAHQFAPGTLNLLKQGEDSLFLEAQEGALFEAEVTIAEAHDLKVEVKAEVPTEPHYM